MRLGDVEKPFTQPIDVGGLARLYKAPPVGISNQLATFGGPSPMTGKVIKRQNAGTVLGIEGGFGVSTASAESFWGKPGTVLRKKIRIDKCPWPDGQEKIRIRCTFNYAQSVGGVGASTASGPVITHFEWNRNTTFNFSLFAACGSNEAQEFFGFGGGSCAVDCKLEAHGVGAGQPLVQDDENPYTETFVTLDVTNANFSQGADYWYTSMSRHHMLPCPQWSIHHINFPGDAYGFFEAASFAHGPIGLVISCDWQVEAVGWTTGLDDDASWHAGDLSDPYLDVNGNPDPPGYELPDKPDSSPYNVGVP